MTKQKDPCSTVYAWLRANLGPRCLAPLTSSDAKALKAAVQIIELYAYDRSAEVLLAFGLVVNRMQPSTRELAYHSIAMVMDWGDRAGVWTEAGLEPLARVGACAFEPGARRAA